MRVPGFFYVLYKSELYVIHQTQYRLMGKNLFAEILPVRSSNINIITINYVVVVYRFVYRFRLFEFLILKLTHLYIFLNVFNFFLVGLFLKCWLQGERSH